MFSRLRNTVKDALGQRNSPTLAPTKVTAPAHVAPPLTPASPAPQEVVANVATNVVTMPPPAPTVVPAEPQAPVVQAEAPHRETPSTTPPAERAAAVAEPAASIPKVSLAAAAAAAAAKGPEKLLHADMGSTDLAHYIARAKANNRDPGSITGGIGINRAADGTPFWGPVDNESSRAKAAGHLLAIDQWECISCGTCVEQTDKVFLLPADEKATPIAQDGPMDLIQDAIEACPVTCIHWVTEDDAADRGLATGPEAG